MMELTTIVINTIEELKEVNPVVVNAVNPRTLEIFHAHCYHSYWWLRWNPEIGEYQETTTDDIFERAEKLLKDPDVTFLASF